MHRDEPADDPEGGGFDAAMDGPGSLVLELGRLLELAMLAIPTCIGVSLILPGRSRGITLSALQPGRHGEPVLSSLAVRLPRPLTAPSPDGGAELVIYAGAPQAFADAAPSLLDVLDMTSRQITMDAHLELPDLAQERVDRERWLDDQNVINVAIGILLESGLLPDEGRLELARRAAAGGTSAIEAARSLIESTTRGHDPA